MIFSPPVDDADDLFRAFPFGETFNTGEDYPGKIKDEQLLFPTAFYQNYDDPSEQGENTEIAKVEETRESGTETIREAFTGIDSGDLGYQSNLDTLGTLSSTNLPPVSTSFSNPETPTKPLEMSFDTKSPATARILSEQSALSAHKLIGVQPSVEPAPISSRQTPASLSSSVTIARTQAGPERNAQFEQPQRHVRAPIRPSNLRTSVSAGPENLGGSQSPQMLAQDMYSYPYQTQANPPVGWDRVHRSGYVDPHRANSPYMGNSSSYSDNVLHGNVTHGEFNFAPLSDNLLLQQPATHLLNTAYYHTKLNSNKRSFHAMTDEESPSETAQSRLKYKSYSQASREQTCSTFNSRYDGTFPRNDASDCHYVERVMNAMFDMSTAEDNGGMKRTWETMMRDKDRVEKAAWEVINVCKQRHKRDKPFELSPKVSRQFGCFEERIQAICEAVQSQKTMCRHLLRQPFAEEVVEDPIAAASRIRNNRKVNHGKKEAINKGRQALGEKALEKVRKYRKVASDDEDEDLENEYDDEYGTQAVNPPKRRSPAQRRRSQATSDDQSHNDGPVTKKVRRSSSSMYQVNEYNQMIDTSIPQPRQERRRLPHPASQTLDASSGNPYGFTSIQESSGQGTTHKELFSGTDFDSHEQAELQRRRSASRR